MNFSIILLFLIMSFPAITFSSNFQEKVKLLGELLEANLFLPDKTFDYKKIIFKLHKKGNADVYDLKKDGIYQLKNSAYNKNQNTKIFIHGYIGDFDNTGERMAKAYLEKTDVNFIIVDWDEFASSKYGYLTQNLIKLIGNEVGVFIKSLTTKFGTRLSNIHCIGFSLGAQICSFAGKFLSPSKIGRITALDPAGPDYNGQPASKRICKNDAKFVDVIHTSELLGMKDSCGTVDFFVNGGKNQPGCGFFGVGSSTCDHLRVNTLFIESINNPKAFPSYKCESYEAFLENRFLNDEPRYMGEHILPKNILDRFAKKSNSKKKCFLPINGIFGNFYLKTEQKKDEVIQNTNKVEDKVEAE